MMKEKTQACKKIISMLLSYSLFHTPLLFAEQLSLPSGDLEAPVVKHTPSTHAAPAGTRTKITATVTDNVGVKSVILFYRKIGDAKYQRKAMINKGKSTYTAVMSEKDMRSPGLEYYIQATDLAGNNLLHGYSFSPLVVNIDNSAKPATKSTAVIAKATPKNDEGGVSKWVWIGLGAVVLAGAAGGGGGGGEETGSLTVSAPVPTNP